MLLILISLICNNREELFNNDITYTIGIPCIPDDIINLDNLIININNQTKLPTDIIIGLSETNDIDAIKLELELNKISKVPVYISNVSNKAYSGINRNRIAYESSNDYIIYIDADDLMHPQRIEIVDKVLRDNNRPIGLIHGLVLYDNSNIKFNNWDTWNGKKLYNYHKNIVPETKSFHLNTINVHHGHPIYSRNIFNNIQYTNMRRGQDVRMVRDILNYYGDSNKNLHYINIPLSNYYPRVNINY